MALLTLQIPIVLKQSFNFMFQGAINGIDSAGVRVVSVTDVTPVPHNGCRPRKTRRL